MAETGRGRRRHDRERVVRNRMRFVRDCMFLYQPGLEYSSDRPRRDLPETGYPPWFIPGRFAKIHPRRVCSCEMCQQHYERPPKGKVRKLIEEEME